MLRALAVCFAIVWGLGYSSAQADTWRRRRRADPAFVVNAPAGWTGSIDQYNNLQFRAQDRSAAVQFSIVNDPRVGTTPLDVIAAQIFSATGAPAYTSTAPGSVLGAPGTTYIGVLPINGVTLQMRLTLAKLDDRHVATLSILMRPEITPAQTAAIDALLAAGALTGR